MKGWLKMASLDFLRKKAAKLQDEKAGLSKKISSEQQKITQAAKEIERINRSITKNTSASLRSTKQRQINTQMDRASKAQKSLATLEKKLSAKMADLSKTLDGIQRAEVAETKKRHQNELKHEREITREKQKQGRIHREMRNPISLQELPEKITVLFLAAGPLDQDQLQLDEEVRAIQAKIRSSEHRDSIILESRWAVRSGDFLQAMNETQPTIVHLSGHSSPDSFCFSDGAGGTKDVSFDALIGGMAMSSDKLRLVVFNSCDSREAAERATEHFDFAIGMGDSISDDAARVFSAQLYSALGFAHSVAKSFGQAKAQLMIEGSSETETPFLFSSESADPDEVILVRPS
jgi:hypothetical protein